MSAIQRLLRFRRNSFSGTACRNSPRESHHRQTWALSRAALTVAAKATGYQARERRLDGTRDASCAGNSGLDPQRRSLSSFFRTTSSALPNVPSLTPTISCVPLRSSQVGERFSSEPSLCSSPAPCLFALPISPAGQQRSSPELRRSCAACRGGRLPQFDST